MRESRSLPHYISAFFRDEIHLARELSADSREIDQVLRVGVTHQYVA